MFQNQYFSAVHHQWLKNPDFGEGAGDTHNDAPGAKVICICQPNQKTESPHSSLKNRGIWGSCVFLLAAAYGGDCVCLSGILSELSPPPWKVGEKLEERENPLPLDNNRTL